MVRLSALLLLLVPAFARAQTRVVIEAPTVLTVAPSFISPVSSLSSPLSVQSFTPALSGALLPSSPAPSIDAFKAPFALSAVHSVVPSAFTPTSVKVAPKAQFSPARLTALTEGVRLLAADIGDSRTDAGSFAAGLKLDALLTGALPAASVDEIAGPSPEVLAVLAVTKDVAARADELGSSRGLKVKSMSGAQFAALVAEAAEATPAGPTPAATAAAKAVARSIARVVTALMSSERPAAELLPRALAVWQVFDQEMRLAAERPDALAAVAADAELFASQVEASVDAPENKPKPRANPTLEEEQTSSVVEGSVFGWSRVEDSPDHGFPLLDRLVRRALADKPSSHAKGFTLPGSSPRADAEVFLYGERHTDAGLIEANMRLLESDAKPGKPMLVLVESYTGRTLRGREAVAFLERRGLDAEALEARGVPLSGLEVSGWDTPDVYDASKHPFLQNHMDLLELNRWVGGGERGWRYYRGLLSRWWTAFKSRRALWKPVILDRNAELDRSLRLALQESAATGATVHVIAGTDHLLESPRLSGVPFLGRPRVRRSLRAAIGDLRWAGGQPAHTIP